VFSKPTVELRALLRREIEFGLLLSRCKAVPQGHSEVNPLRRWEFQELRQGVCQRAPDPPTPGWLHKVTAAANAAVHLRRAERPQGPRRGDR